MNQLSEIETSPADVQPIIQKPVPTPPAESEFLGPEAQIERMIGWAKKYAWPIGAQELRTLPKPPELLPGTVLVLEPEFGEHQKTVLGLLDAVRGAYKKSYIDSLMCSRELHYSNDVRKRGFSWRRMRVRGALPRRAVMYPGRCPSAAVLAFVALHPSYVSRMNGSDIPYLWVPGFQVHLREGRPQPKTAQVQAPGRAEVNGRMRISYDRGVRGLSIIVDFFGGTHGAEPSDPYTAIPDFY